MGDVTPHPMNERLEKLIREAVHDEVHRQLKVSLHVDTESADSLSVLSRTLDWAYRRMKADESTTLAAKRVILGLVLSGIAYAVVQAFKLKGGQ